MDRSQLRSKRRRRRGTRSGRARPRQEVDAQTTSPQTRLIRGLRRLDTDLCGIEVSPELISTVTDAVHEQVPEWQNRPLEPLYALVFFDALRVKVRDEGMVRNKAVYLALGARPDGTKEALGPSGRLCHAVTSASTPSVIVLMKSGLTSVSYVSSRNAWISRTVRPRA
jgi:hypothetical protein